MSSGKFCRNFLFLCIQKVELSTKCFIRNFIHLIFIRYRRAIFTFIRLD
uniref:Uncharacterized protein n=1 Tax=Arundo donax TaxID=35708 RepID=A0A0A9D325_ARUDO